MGWGNFEGGVNILSLNNSAANFPVGEGDSLTKVSFSNLRSSASNSGSKLMASVPSIMN